MEQRNFRTARTAVRVHELTDGMLVHARNAADSSYLAQTVWPSRFIGEDYLGHGCLVVTAYAVTDRVPEGVAKGAEPLLTVLPANYLRDTAAAAEAHRLGQCSSYCRFPGH
ncbi:hypothetical protein ACIO1C_29750 [Streptomyces sp. NPDC087420]|uniref:hypothetical protein n=1 Tax=Streptomyces sp. NPDC087420 TaxID=3365785 RepID=UPI0038354248